MNYPHIITVFLITLHSVTALLAGELPSLTTGERESLFSPTTVTKSNYTFFNPSYIFQNNPQAINLPNYLNNLQKDNPDHTDTLENILSALNKDSKTAHIYVLPNRRFDQLKEIIENTVKKAEGPQTPPPAEPLAPPPLPPEPTPAPVLPPVENNQNSSNIEKTSSFLSQDTLVKGTKIALLNVIFIVGGHKLFSIGYDVFLKVVAKRYPTYLRKFKRHKNKVIEGIMIPWILGTNYLWYRLILKDR
jgi:hypothetical protein